MVKSCFRKLVLPLVCDYVGELRICSPMVRTGVCQLLILREMNIYVNIFILLWMQHGKKNCYQTTSCVIFCFVFLSQLCLRQHGRNFIECQRKLVSFSEYFFLYAQPERGISELYLSNLNTAVIVIDQVTVMNNGFGFHA